MLSPSSGSVLPRTRGYSLPYFPCNSSENPECLPPPDPNEAMVPCNRTVVGYLSTVPAPKGYWPFLAANGERVNGGVPQAGNLSLHLGAVRSQVPVMVPDVDFSGNIILDFEEWSPTWLFARPQYQNLSLTLAIEANSSLKGNLTAAWAAAKEEYEAGALKFYVRTVALIRSMRPNASVGYYGHPTTSTSHPNGTSVTFPKGYFAWQREENDRLAPLWEAGSGLFPQVYMQRCPFGVHTCLLHQSPRWWSELEASVFRVVAAEATRLSQTYTISNSLPHGAPVIPMLWGLYLSAGNQVVSPENIWRVLEAVWQPPHNTKVVLWGGPDHYNVASNNNVTGPVMAMAVAESTSCSRTYCNGHGWCKNLRHTGAGQGMPTCVCSHGWCGTSCNITTVNSRRELV